MSHCTYATSCALKEAGLPQPTPEIGQFWWSPFTGSVCICCNRGDTGEHQMLAPVGLIEWSHHFGAGSILPGAIELTYLPTLEYIVSLLPIPQLFHFEIWNNTHSCRFLDDENPRRTFGETFTEAAAKMYLELKQNAPTSDFSKMGDVAQE